MSVVVTAALSVSEQIKDLGAYAGVASIVGLAVLSLLYFGQARELKRLREWAGRAPERTAELQEQAAAAAAAPRRIVAQPGTVRAAAAPGTAATPATAAATAATPVVPAPATAAAAAATRPGAPGALEITKTPAVAAAATPPASASPAAGAPATSAGQETQAMDAVPAAGQPASTPAPGPGVPVAPVVPVSPTASPADPSTGSQETPVPLVKASAPGAVPPRPRPAPSVPASVRARVAEPPPPAEQEPAGGRRGLLAYAAGGVAVLLVLIVLATQLLGGSDDPASTTDAAVPAQTQPEPNAIEDPSTSATTQAEAPALVRSDFSVFVLNGTATNGLGASVNSRLEKLGYRPAGSPQTAADQTETVTRVSYAEGKKRAANDVAKQLGVSQANVVPVDAGTNAQGAGADVIVTIGADKAAQ